MMSDPLEEFAALPTHPMIVGLLSAMPPPPDTIPPPAKRNSVEAVVTRLGEEVAAFEAGLSAEEEVGGIIIGAPDGTAFHITGFYHLSPDILVFQGINAHSKPQRLVQHVSQLNILLTALPKMEPTARRIGFLPPDGTLA